MCFEVRLLQEPKDVFMHGTDSLGQENDGEPVGLVVILLGINSYCIAILCMDHILRVVQFNAFQS